MKNKINSIFLVYFLTLSVNSYSQVEANQKLYWDYRDRLKKTFIKIGSGQGESLPMEWFDFDADCRPTGPNHTDPATNKGVIHWADATCYLGDYLGVLATEFKLLKNANQDVTATLSEIYYALKAIRRLDDQAEVYLSSQSSHLSPNPNGFFMRDDIKSSFKNNWSDRYVHTNDRRDMVTAVSSSYGKEIETSDCSKIFPSEGFFNKYNEESQDQLIYLLQGLALVKKLVDDEFVKPTAADVGFNVVSEAKSIATDLSNYIFSPKSFSLPFDPAVASAPLLPLTLPALTPLLLTLDPIIISSVAASLTIPTIFLLTTDDDLDFYDITYCIKNPVRDSLVESGGGWMQPFAYPLTETVKFITGRTQFPSVEADVHLQNTTNHISMDVEDEPKDWWENFRDQTGDFEKYNIDCGPLLGEFTIDMSALFASDFNKYMTILFASISNTWNGTQIHDHGAPYGMLSPELIHAVLFDESPPNSDPNFYKSYLDNAPCEGPSEYASNGWNHPQRWSSPNTTRLGFYNGMDYMLFYNLFRLKFESDYPNNFTPYSNKNACPCTFTTPIEGINKTFGSTQIIEDNISNNILLNQITIAPVFLNGSQNDYAEKGISVSDYLSHNLTIQNTGKMTVLTELVVCNNSTLEIQNNDGLIVGDGTMLGCILKIRSGSTLKLKSISKITINNKSKIIIEPGGHFIYEPGAHIVLQGKDALLDVQDVNTTITLNSGEQMILDLGTASEGGTMKLAGGSFTMNAQSALTNTNCKLMLAAPVAFQVQPSVSFILIGDKALVDVLAGTTITIGNGKTIYLMGFNSGRHGELYLHNGTFNLQTGGSIYSKQCCLHFGAGMEFNYQQNATLQLDGDDAVLDIGGNLVLKQDAVFKFIWNQNDFNSGYIRMSGLPDWHIGGCKNLWCGINCRFALQGKDKNDKILEIAQETLYDPTCAHFSHGDLEMFSLISGKVEFAGGASLGYNNGARLALAGPCKLLNIHFVNRDQDSWRNVIVFGQENVTIVNDKFEGADAGLIGALYNGHRLSVSNCEFYKCTTGMFKHHGGMTLSGNTFHECAIGYTSLGGTFSDNIIDNTIHDCYMGFDFELGSTPSEYLLTKNILYNNDVPVSIDGGSVSARCNSITNNSFEAIELFNNGNLNMNSTRGAGYNDLSHNDLLFANMLIWTLYLNEGGTLDMQDGYNNLSPTGQNQCTDASSWCSEGCREVFGGEFYYNGSAGTLFSPACASQDYPILVADHNKWKDNRIIPFTSYCFENLFNADASCTDGNIRQAITITDASPIAQIPDCGTYDNGNGTGTGQRNALVRCDNCEQVPVSINSTTRLDSAIRKGIALLDTSLAQYTQAIDLFSYVLNYRLATPDVEGEAYLTGLAYIYLNTAYSRAIDGKQISVVPPFTTIDANAKKVLDIQKARIAQAITDSVYNTRFYMSIDLANSFRMLQMRDSSIALYNYMQTFADSADLPLVQKWLCYVTSENDYVKGVISIDEFLSVVSECFPHQETEGRFASGYQRPLTPEKQNKLKKAINIYPNPATNQMIISLKNFGSDNKYILIYDCLGNVVKDFGSTSKNEIEENVSNYTKGIYLVKAVSGKQVLTTKFVVN